MVERRTFNPRFRPGFDPLTAHRASLAQWKAHPVSTRLVPGSNPGRRIPRSAGGSGQTRQVLTLEYAGSNPARTTFVQPMAPSSMGKIAAFHVAEQGSTPCGATKAAVRQDRYEDGKARHSRSGVVQSVGRCPVKAAIWVRIPVPEPWWRSSVRSRALARQARGHGFKSRRHRAPEKPRSCGEKEIMPDYGSGGGGSSPSGSASRSAGSMGERAVHTREMNRFDSFAEYGGCSSSR